MKNKIIFIIIILLVFMILLIPLKGSYAFYSDNKDLNIINTKVGDFTTESTLDLLNSKPKDLSPTIQGDMYRYQGTDNVANWICFGTSSKDECLNNIDKYMYRIIGITFEGELYLIKETFIEERDNVMFPWNNFYYSVDPDDERYCPEGLCPEWPNSSLFKRINGISNGIGNNTDIFIDSEYYDYLKSGDKINGTTSPSKWYDLIVEHDWMYGDTNDISSVNKYNGDVMYAIEHGDKETTHYVGIKGDISEKPYTWTKSIKAKISLMYIHDYCYSYYDGINEDTRGNAESSSKLKNSWMFYAKDGYATTNYYELLSTSHGIVSPDDPRVTAYVVATGGSYGYTNYSTVNPSRTVFYLNKNVILYKRSGTKEDPFIIKI